MADDISAVEEVLPVSRETGQRLEIFVALLRKWQPAENLVSPKALPEIWRRHVADCAQLVKLFPGSKRWLDLGSGAGFPGLIIAMHGAEQVHMVESNRRKCAFLRAAIRETDLRSAVVHEGRIEDVLRDWKTPVDRVTARALAPLADLFALAEPVMGQGVPAAFPKGQEFQSEIDAAARSWRFDVTRHDSLIGQGGVILNITGLRRKRESG